MKNFPILRLYFAHVFSIFAKTNQRNDEYSIFTYDVRPTFDFIQEILRNGEDMEVLAPKELREEVAAIVKRMNKKYN